MRLQLCFALLCTSMIASAQKVISLTPQPVQINGTYQYRNITVMDSRKDTALLGRVVKGTFGVSEALAPLVLKEPLMEAYNNFYRSSVAHLQPGDQDILIHITDLFVDEEPVFGPTGTVNFRAEVYALKDGLHYPIYVCDRNEMVSAFDATKKLINELQLSLKNAVELSHGFFSPAVFEKKGLNKDEVLVAHLEERKTKFPVYTSEVFKDGVYSTLQEFLDNNPSRSIDMLEGFIATNMAKPKRKREKLFGYCRNGVFTHFFNDVNYTDTTGIYMRAGELYMQNYGLDDAKQGTQNVLSFFTPASMLLNTESWYEFVLNPRSGQWYQMRKLGNRKRNSAPAEVVTAPPAG